MFNTQIFHLKSYTNTFFDSSDGIFFARKLKIKHGTSGIFDDAIDSNRIIELNEISSGDISGQVKDIQKDNRAV